MAVKITTRDRGARALAERLRGVKRTRAITVGIHEDDGAEATEEGLTVAEVAEINEFGLGVPERSFVRSFAEENEAEHVANMRKLGVAIVKGKTTAIAGLEAVASVYRGKIQAKIASGIAPENAESTIRQKGSSTPLVNTGQLRSSADARVEQ